MVSPLLSTVSLSVLAGAGWFWLTGNRSVAGPELDPLDNVTFSPPQTRSSPVEDLVRFKLQIETITPSIDDILTEKWLIMIHTDWCPYSTQAIEEWPQLLETVAERTKSIRTPSSNTTGDSKDKNAQTFPEIIHVSAVSLSSAILLAAGLNTDRLPFYAVVADGKYLPIDKMSLIDSNIDLAFQDVDNYGLHIKISPHKIRSWQMYIFDTISRYIMHFQRYVAESIGSGALLTHLIISSILVSSLACERLGVFKYL